MFGVFCWFCWSQELLCFGILLLPSVRLGVLGSVFAILEISNGNWKWQWEWKWKMKMQMKMKNENENEKMKIDLFVLEGFVSLVHLYFCLSFFCLLSHFLLNLSCSHLFLFLLIFSRYFLALTPSFWKMVVPMIKVVSLHFVALFWIVHVFQEHVGGNRPCDQAHNGVLLESFRGCFISLGSLLCQVQVLWDHLGTLSPNILFFSCRAWTS